LPDWRGRARRRFGVQAEQVHIDTTSFSVCGDYASHEEGDPVALAITYGSSRDHRQDLKQWMLALATTHDGDVPIASRDQWVATVRIKSI
jgi:transposase